MDSAFLSTTTTDVTPHQLFPLRFRAAPDLRDLPISEIKKYSLHFYHKSLKLFSRLELR